ncbi:MAG: TIGR02391 family protein, partial [bacterium]
VLGDTETGLSGSEIARLLGSLGFSDPGPITKRERLLAAMQDAQMRDDSGRPVARLIESSMDPVNYRGDRSTFEERQHDLNVVLSFAGIRLRDDGKLEAVPAAATLTEAERRASKLRSELAGRGIADDVLRFCRPELLEGNYFHAVFEATKSVAQKLRDRTGLTSDGGTLVAEALGIQSGKTPLLAWNTLVTENEKNEHRGVALMIRGVFAYFRNLPAHVPKVGFRTVAEEEALELLTIVSFLHRRLDAAVSTRIPSVHSA